MTILLLAMVFYAHLVASFNRHRLSRLGPIRLSNISKRTLSRNSVTKLFSSKFDIDTLRGFKISDFWIDRLKDLERPAAYELISQLKPNANELGYESSKVTKTPPKASGFFHDTVQSKIKYSDKVILVRNGEFYETFGVDALMLINYCGLNPMAGTCRAGCPIKNVQDTLDGLTNAGLSVAVFEEVVETNANKGPTKKSGGKERFLSQIVSPAYRTYAYNLNLRQGNIEYRDPVPLWGIMKTVGGYLACQVWLDEQRVLVSERLTAEAVRILMSESSYIEPIFVNPEAAEDTALSPLPSTSIISGYSDQEFPSQVLRRIEAMYQIDISSFQQLPIVSKNRPRMLYTSTALQIGLLPNKNVPALTPYLLPKLASAHSSRFLNRWILHPPPAELADHMQSLCRHLSQLPVSLPPCNPIPLGKVVSLLNAKQSNVVLIKDIRTNVAAVLYMLETVKSDPTHPFRQVVDNVMPIVSFETGLSIPEEKLFAGCHRVVETIDAFIDASTDTDLITTDPKGRIPENFFIQNENTFRGQISLSQPDISDLYARLNMATQQLLDAVNKDFSAEWEVVNDFHENAIFAKAGKEKPATTRSRAKKQTTVSTTAGVDAETNDSGSPSNSVSIEVPSAEPIKLMPARDRYGKPLPGRYTSEAVSRALAEYVELAEYAPEVVVQLLQRLSGDLLDELAVVQQCAHWAVVQSAVAGHVTAAKQNGWTLPELQVFSSQVADPLASGSGSQSSLEAMRMKVTGLTPYWIDRARATANDLDLSGTFLLTAPNMSGKSTIMRASLVVALLANCGLFVPAQFASVPRYDSFFLRTASYDIPSESKSAFALEMDDMRVLLRDCSARSLVMVDELGKGTSARDGSALAGALLEELDVRGCSGIFATHLHEVFELPLSLSRVSYKRMGIEQGHGPDDKQWTYKLEDGKCTDSLALHTARQYSIPSSIIKRAEQLASDFDATCRGRSTQQPISTQMSDNQVESLKQQPERFTETPKPSTSYEAPRNVWTSRRVTYGTQPVTVNTPQLFTPRAKPAESSLTSTRETLVASAALSGMVTRSAVIESDDVLRSAKREYNLDDMLTLFRRLSGLKQIVLVEPKMLPPPSLEGQSAVYVLHIQSKPDSIYVGETESIGQRLQQHRKYYKDAPIRAAVMGAPNKSSARKLESQLITALKERGYSIERDSDESHRLFGGS